jgi:hypothetical protein
MKKSILILSIFLSFTQIGGRTQTQPIPSEFPCFIQKNSELSEVIHLLSKVPKNQLEEFVGVLQNFAAPRNFDWRLCLLIMHNESRINTKEKAGSFGGLIMFDTDARRMLKASFEELLSMSYVAQAKAAVILWEAAEKMTGTKITSFIELQVSTFMPIWLKSEGNPFPASEQIKKQNFPFVGANGEISKESLLKFYRKKVAADASLKFFLGKI